jgi:hypothetical protein
VVNGIVWSDGTKPDADDVSKLRLSIRNTIRNATNFKGSTIENLLDKPREQNDNSRPVNPSTEVTKPKAAAKTAPAKAVSWGDDEPEDVDSPFG